MTEEITPYPGDLIDVDQAAQLCGVSPITIRTWINSGYTRDADGKPVKLPTAGRGRRPRDGRMVTLLNPVEVAKADHATAPRARRIVIRGGQFPAAVSAA